MPKLPKAMLERKKALEAKAKGRTAAARGGIKASRAYRRKLKQQGIENMEQIDATEVIIRTPEKDLVISDPQVLAITQQGIKIFQIIGEPEERAPGYIAAAQTAEEEGGQPGTEIETAEESPQSAVPEITEEDVRLVASQAGVTPEEARKALENADGDLAIAILNLKKQKGEI